MNLDLILVFFLSILVAGALVDLWFNADWMTWAKAPTEAWKHAGYFPQILWKGLDCDYCLSYQLGFWVTLGSYWYVYGGVTFLTLLLGIAAGRTLSWANMLAPPNAKFSRKQLQNHVADPAAAAELRAIAEYARAESANPIDYRWGEPGHDFPGEPS